VRQTLPIRLSVRLCREEVVELQHPEAYSALGCRSSAARYFGQYLSYSRTASWSNVAIACKKAVTFSIVPLLSASVCSGDCFVRLCKCFGMVNLLCLRFRSMSAPIEFPVVASLFNIGVCDSAPHSVVRKEVVQIGAMAMRWLINDEMRAEKKD
jgi:hypothetical protein